MLMDFIYVHKKNIFIVYRIYYAVINSIVPDIIPNQTSYNFNSHIHQTLYCCTKTNLMGSNDPARRMASWRCSAATTTSKHPNSKVIINFQNFRRRESTIATPSRWSTSSFPDTIFIRQSISNTHSHLIISIA